MAWVEEAKSAADGARRRNSEFKATSLLLVNSSELYRLPQLILVQRGREEVEDYPLFKPCTNGKKIGLKRLEPELEALLIKNSISPKPLHKTLALINNLNKKPDDPLIAHERLALAKQLVYSISNLRFGPEVGVGKPKEDAPVIAPWLKGVKDMANDLCCTQVKIHKAVPSLVKLTDSRSIDSCLEPLTFDAVITSPPYPNEKDYTRTTRLEAVLLGYLNNRDDLRRQKQNLLRSNSRGVYKADVDECWVQDNERIQELADQIETRRLELKKTSGFEKLYARVVRLYFGGMARHLEELKQVLAPGAQLAYVVGDQASFFRILIRTGELLANIAEDLGYEVTGIDLFRTRFSTATREHLREEVVLLRWNS